MLFVDCWDGWNLCIAYVCMCVCCVLCMCVCSVCYPGYRNSVQNNYFTLLGHNQPM